MLQYKETMARRSRFTLPPARRPTDPPVTNEQLSKQEFARHLGKLMLDKGWNQADLAKQSGVGPDSISTYMRARSFPDPKSLKKMADAFRLTPRDLLPNSELSAIGKEAPSFEMKQVPGHPNKTWLYINRAMTFNTAAKIVALLQEEDVDK